MRFRTEIESLPHTVAIDHGDGILMLGSCFTDNIGARLEKDGFQVVHNPLGPLYNPLSIAQTVNRALTGYTYCHRDLTSGHRGWHCLDYASRYSGSDSDVLLDMINGDFAPVCDMLAPGGAKILIITFGSAYVFTRKGSVVGNCHKFPASTFEHRRLEVEEIVTVWSDILERLPEEVQVIFTVSPIRHLADGLHGNQLGKAILLLTVDRLVQAFPKKAHYFPAYEIVMDDLRDYRFYASDMKHPSEVAVDYIYEIFSQTFFSAMTAAKALKARKESARNSHRPILEG